MQFPVPLRLLFLAVLIVSLSSQPVFLLGAGFLQISNEIDLSVTGLGVLTALFFFVASIASPIGGKIVQQVGWRLSLRVNAIISIAVLLAIALFAKSVFSFGVLLLAGALIYATSNPAANMVLSEYVDPTRRALIFGWKHAGIPFSTLLAGLAVPLVIVSAGWRWAYAISAFLGIIVLALIPNKPLPRSNTNTYDPRRRVAPMSQRRLLALGAGSAMATWSAVALSTYLVAAAVNIGISESIAGYILFSGSVVSITVRVIAGRITDRIGGTGFGGMVTLIASGAIIFALIPLASGWLFAVVVISAFATGWGWPGLMTFSVVNANPDSVASSSAITQAGILIGAGASPLVLGWAAENWTFDAIWLIVSAALCGAVIIISLVGQGMKKHT